MHDRLGRLPSLNEERLTRFPLRSVLGTAPAKVNRAWRLSLRLDQVGPSCTGHCGIYDLAAQPIPLKRPDGKPFREEDALEHYRGAQQMDEWPGDDYEGSSVDGCLRWELANGYVGSYHWANPNNPDEVLYALSNIGPVRMGTSWTSDMFDPDVRTALLSPTGSDEGGHSYLLNAVNWRGYAMTRSGFRKVANEPVVRLTNSWWDGNSYDMWGYKGTALLTRTGLGDLLAANGEAAVIDVALRRG